MKKTLLFAALCLMAVCNTITAADYYVAGPATLCGTEWSANDPANKMTDNGDGTYSKTYTNLTVGIYEFKITDGTWGKDWGAPAVDLSKSSTGLIAQSTGKEGNIPNAKFSIAGAGDVTIHFDGNSIWIEGTFGIPDYYVAGPAALCGTEWSANDAANKMTDNGDGTCSKTYANLAVGTYEFKITDGDWDHTTFGGSAVDPYKSSEGLQSQGSEGANAQFTTSVAGDVTIHFDGSKIWIIGTFGTPPAPDYYITGDSALCNGVNWEPGAEVNKMTLNEDSTYTKVFTDVAAGTYSFKVTGDTYMNQWGGEAVDLSKSSTGLQAQSIEEGGIITNAQFTTSAAGDVSIHFDGTNIWIEGTFGEATINMVTIVWANISSDGYCDPTSFAGTTEDPTNTANNMILNDNTWKKTYTNVTLEEGKYSYKVVGNNIWALEYPGSGLYHTLTVRAEQAGTCTLTFLFNGDFKDTPNLTCILTRSTAIEESVTTTPTVRVSGSTILVSDPDITYSIHNLSGADVTHLNGNLTQGLYLVQTAGTVTKVMVK